MRRLLIGIAPFLLFLVGFTGQTATPGATTLQPISHVILIMEENHSFSQTYGTAMPYLTSLANTYAYESNEHSIGLPSLPNYIALTSGNTQKAGGGSFIGTDCSPSESCSSTSDNIFHQAGAAWRVWAESEPKHCDPANSGEYAVRHTSAPYYQDLTNCATNDVGYPSTPGWSTAKYVQIAPNLLHDAHDGTIAAADTWLKGKVPQLLANSSYTNGSTLIEVTWDSGGPNNTVETVFVNPRLSHRHLTLSATHYSLLRLNEELLGFPLLGSARTASDLRPALGL